MREHEALRSRQPAPALLGGERDHRMRQREHLLKCGARELRRGKSGLQQLQVPVAQVVEHQVVEAVRELAELEALHQAIGFRDGGADDRGDPAVAQRLRRRRLACTAAAVHHQAGGVPQLGDQLPALTDAVLAEPDVLRRGDHEQAEPQGVRALALHHLQRIDPGAQALAHAAAVGRLHHRVDVHVAERHLAHVLQPHHHHAGHPQEDDLAGGGEDAGGVEALELHGAVGPAERRERPQGRGEPRVEHVGVALPPVALGCLHADVHLVTAVPHRQLVSPPQLARQAPGADVGEPIPVHAAPCGRREAHVALLLGHDGGPGKRLHVAEPLQGQKRLHACAGAVREGHRVQVVLGPADEPLCLQVGHHAGLRVIDGEPAVGLGRGIGDAAVLADHLDGLQAVAAHDLEVVRVVGRGHLQGAGAERRVHVLVADDGDLAPRQRQRDHLPHQVAVALVVGVHRHCGVAQHGLGAHRGHHHLARAVGQRVGDAHEGVGHLAVLHLQVGDGRPEARVPVDQVGVAVDVALLVQIHEHAQHRARVAVVHREPLAREVHGAAETRELLDDAPAVLGLPCPHPLEELLAGHVQAAHALLRELLLHHRLGGDARMVGARDPLGLEARHAVAADQDILDGAVKGVPHVQRARHVGRRHSDHVRRAGA